MPLESEYQAGLIKRLRERFPGCVVLKNDTDYLQGIPDLSVFFRKKWAWLEVKSSQYARPQPNQEYYVELANELSFGSFIFPECEEEVVDALQRSFQPRRSTRVSQS